MSYLKHMRHYFQWAKEKQGADETWSLMDQLEWDTLKLYMDRFAIIPYMMFENKYLYIYIYM